MRSKVAPDGTTLVHARWGRGKSKIIETSLEDGEQRPLGTFGPYVEVADWKGET